MSQFSKTLVSQEILAGTGLRKKCVLKFTEFWTRNGTESMIPDTEGCSIKLLKVQQNHF